MARHSISVFTDRRVISGVTAYEFRGRNKIVLHFNSGSKFTLKLHPEEDCIDELMKYFQNVFMNGYDTIDLRNVLYYG